MVVLFNYVIQYLSHKRVNNIQRAYPLFYYYDYDGIVPGVSSTKITNWRKKETPTWANIANLKHWSVQLLRLQF